MKRWVVLALVLCLLCLPASVLGQKEKPVPVCSEAAFAAVKPLPKLTYECNEDLASYDDKVLVLPQRLAAIRQLNHQLKAFDDEGWWRAGIDELNACTIHQSTGALTDDEQKQWRQGDYSFNLMGNRQMRLMLIDDPCYQTGFAGANAFLLYRKDGRSLFRNC